MSSRRTTLQSLSDIEIEQIATEIAGGRPPMVWFTAAAVGIPEGRSGKVIALGDPAEGDFLQVRPTGSKDVLSFGPTEVTLIKPARAAAPAKPAAKAQPAAARSGGTAATDPDIASRKDNAVTQPSTVVSPAPVSSPSVSSSLPADPAPGAEAKPAAKPAGQRAAKAPASGARKVRTVEVMVTLSGTADGEWTVDVVNGKKRSVKGLVVSGSTAAQVAALLHPEVAEVVDSVLESVRSSQRARVEALQAELENARRLLDDLS
ncbi:DUF6319 family protein [Nocardia stercoris]|uniref:Cell wall anchor protein n=1 Tax=Nocardia stercoris TaxID=2483361 RepID=A0A3M2LEL4_9NOCA|nr:DUF6319 family protein [Nocardia stercoris]RMI35220.1 hypothetical protein EBN03_02715 [Nocardia stercoris]